uniref:Uncharacterized protein n=1 Tax=Aegilops tauschii subsp. strangulata TaxID=200361 RepID=A0A453A9N0_AEGTS
MANCFGEVVDDERLNKMERYMGKPKSRQDRAREAWNQISKDDKDANATRLIARSVPSIATKIFGLVCTIEWPILIILRVLDPTGARLMQELKQAIARNLLQKSPSADQSYTAIVCHAPALWMALRFSWRMAFVCIINSCSSE